MEEDDELKDTLKNT
jgi:BRCT domain type II-containing protein